MLACNHGPQPIAKDFCKASRDASARGRSGARAEAGIGAMDEPPPTRLHCTSPQEAHRLQLAAPSPGCRPLAPHTHATTEGVGAVNVRGGRSEAAAERDASKAARQRTQPSQAPEASLHLLMPPMDPSAGLDPTPPTRHTPRLRCVAAPFARNRQLCAALHHPATMLQPFLEPRARRGATPHSL